MPIDVSKLEEVGEFGSKAREKFFLSFATWMSRACGTVGIAFEAGR